MSNSNDGPAVGQLKEAVGEALDAVYRLRDLKASGMLDPRYCTLQDRKEAWPAPQRQGEVKAFHAVYQLAHARELQQELGGAAWQHAKRGLGTLRMRARDAELAINDLYAVHCHPRDTKAWQAVDNAVESFEEQWGALIDMGALEAAPAEGETIDVATAAARLGKSESTVRRWCARMKKPCHNAQLHAGAWHIFADDVRE